MGDGLPQPSPPPLPSMSGGSEKRKVDLPPKLEQLSSMMRNSAQNIVRYGLDQNLDSKIITEPLIQFTLSTIEKKCVTVAGLAKVLLVLMHPHISEKQKMDAMPSAGLAFRATDTDILTRGEQRLLRAVIKQYCKKDGHPRTKKEPFAQQMLQNKRDVVEILTAPKSGAKGLGNGPANKVGTAALPALKKVSMWFL